jgi:ubiquinone/menaquinone biosynthesis C-methylase UbiE
MNKNEVASYFDSIASQRDRWRKRSNFYHQDIIKLVNFLLPNNSSALVVGCSTGDLLASLSKEGDKKGIDISEKMVAIAKNKYPNLSFEKMDVENLEMTEKFDYLILSDVIGYLDDVQKAFNELLKVSHSKTKLVITYYNFLWEPILKLAEKIGLKMPEPIQNWLSEMDIKNILDLAGFEVVKNGSRMLLPMNIPLISPLFNRFLANTGIFRKLCLVNYLVARPKPGLLPIKPNPSVTVLIPARNEKGNIENAIKRLSPFGSHLEIIFVEGNSSDNTWEEILRVKSAYPNLDIKAFKQVGKGKGDAVRTGFAQASGDILIILDADLTVRPEDLYKFYEAISNGVAEFINGSRLVYQLEDQSMRLLNIFGNKFFSFMFSWLLGQYLKDTLCGTKVLWREDYIRIIEGRKYFGDFDPFGDFDLLFGAAKLNLKIVDLPIRYQARTYGTTNISRFRHGLILLRMCLFAMKKIKFI